MARKQISGIAIPEGFGESTFRDVLSAAFAAYFHYNKTPSIDEIKEFTSHSKLSISKIIQTEEFSRIAKARGIEWGDSLGLSPEQQFAISVITNPTDRRALGAKLKSVGVPYSRYRAWLKQPLFKRYISKIAEDALGEHKQDVDTALLAKAISGDNKAMQFYYEMTGAYNPAGEQVIDLQRLVGTLLEIITKNIKDPVVLDRISTEMDYAIKGKKPRAIEEKPIPPVGEDITDAELVEDEAIFNF